MGFDVLEFTRRKAEEEAAYAAAHKQSQPRYTEDEVRQMSLDLAQKKLYEETAGTVNSESMTQLLTDIQGLKTPVVTGSVPKTSGGYYSRPVTDVSDIQSRMKTLNSAAMAFSYPVAQAKRATEKAATGLQSASANLKSAYDAYKTTPTWEAAQAYNQALSVYQSAKTGYETAYGAYQTAYDEYQKIAGEADTVFAAWQKYADASQAEYDAWKSTIRDVDTISREIAWVDERIAEAKKQKGYDFFDLFGEDPAIQEWEKKKALLQEELDWSKYYYYNALADSADFTANSKYVPQEYQARSNLDIVMNNYSNSPWEDPLYEYINGNEKAGAYISNAAANYYGSDNPLGAIFGRATENKAESRQMEKTEIATFNYLYATQGKEAAHVYYNYLLSDLNLRQRQVEEKYWKKYAADDRFGASVFSVAMSPLKGLSYLGQATDYITTGQIDQNSSYNKFSYVNSAIRSQAAQAIEEKWGKVGSFAYQTGMSMLDFVTNAAISGGNGALSMAIMGSGAAADTTIAAKDRGLSDDQAFALGTIAGAAEAITERFSLEALLKPGMSKAALSYILRNALVEGSEEGASTLINTMADIIISKDKSEWTWSIQAYRDMGKNEGEAFGLALADQAIALGLDVLGGVISGGVMGAGGSIVNRNQYSSLGQKLGLGDVTLEQAQEIIDSGLESGTDTEAYQMALKLQKKIDAGKVPTKGELAQQLMANEQVIQTETTTGEDANTGIREQLRTNQKMLNRMKPVANITTPGNFAEMDLDAKKNWVIEKLRPTGYAVERKGFGIIDFAQKKLRAAFNYFKKGSAEEAAFEALPYVLEKGVEIFTRENHKGRKYSTVTFAAPVTINGQRGNMAVVVRQTQGNQYKVHRVLLPDGSAFYISETENEAESSTTRGVADTGSLASSKDTASRNIIDRGSEIVNTNDQNGGNRNGSTENGLAAERGDQPTGAADTAVAGREPWGANLSDGGQGRYAGTGAGEQTGRLAAGTGRGQTTDRARAFAQRENRINAVLDIEASSPASFGIRNGSKNETMKLIPVGRQDESLRQIDRLFEEHGVNTYFYTGLLEIKRRDGSYFVTPGVLQGNSVFIQADNTRLAPEQIGKHELFHVLRRENPGLVQRIAEDIKSRYTEAEFEAIVEKYIKRYGGVIDMTSEDAIWKIWEEILADAYAGIDPRNAGVTKYAEMVQELTNQYTGERGNMQSNGTRQTNGPNSQAVENETPQYLIMQRADGKRYVKADREVITGDDPDLWGKQLEHFINEKIRKGEDVVFPTEDGHFLVLTGRSAYKLGDRHKSEIANKIRPLLSDANYALKARAAGHIDELIQVAQFDRYREDLNAAHENDIGEDGFNYFIAFFEDANGEKYRIPFSAALNEEMETVYSIGEIRKRRTSPSRGPSGKTGAQKDGRSPSAPIIYTSTAESQEKTAFQIAMEKAGYTSEEVDADEQSFLLDDDGEHLAEMLAEYMDDVTLRYESAHLDVDSTYDGSLNVEMNAIYDAIEEYRKRNGVSENIKKKLGYGHKSIKDAADDIVENWKANYDGSNFIHRKLDELQSTGHAISDPVESTEKPLDVPAAGVADAEFLTVGRQDQSRSFNVPWYEPGMKGRSIGPEQLPRKIDSAKDAIQAADAMRDARQDRERPMNVPKEKFDGTDHLKALGVKVENSVGDYWGIAQAVAQDKAAKQLKKQIRRAEIRLAPTEAEKEFAAGIAAGKYYPEDIPGRMDYEAVTELADYYQAEKSMDTHLLREKKSGIAARLQEDMQTLFKDSDAFTPSKALVLNYRTPERNMLQIFGDERGKAINDAIFSAVAVNEAERYRFMNRMFDEVRTFEDSNGKKRELTQEERAMTMILMEGNAASEIAAEMEMAGSIRNAAENIKNGEDPGDAAIEWGLNSEERKLAERMSQWMQAKEAMNSDNVDAGIVEKAAQKYGEQFNKFYDAINDFLVAHGYETIGFIRGYAPHLQPEKTQTTMKKVFHRLGIDADVAELPTNIAGMTGDFKPNKRWNPHMQHRRGNKAQYDVAKAYESYVEYMSDILYHTDDIMRVRQAVNYFRRTYAPEEIKNMLEWAEELRHEKRPEQKAAFLRAHGSLGNTSVLSKEDIDERFNSFIDEEYMKIENAGKYSEFVKYLDNYANILAGKQSARDRGAEANGRVEMSRGNKLVQIFGRSQVAGSISSALNQSAQLPMIIAEVGQRNVARAAWDIASGKLKKAAWAQESDFLTGKKGVDFLVTDPEEMILSKMFKPAEFVDGFISTLAVRGEYLKQIKEGKSHHEAMKLADKKGTAIMGSRMKGSKPVAFHAKNLLDSMVNVFQVEALNAWEHLAKDLPRDFSEIAAEKGKKVAAGALAGVVVKYLLAAFLLNRFAEEEYGGTPAPFDILGLTANFIASGEGLATNEYLCTMLDNAWEKMTGERPFETDATALDGTFNLVKAAEDAAYNVANDVPFLRNVAAVMGVGDSTLPIPDIGGTAVRTATNALEGEWEKIPEELFGLATDFIPGGRQLEKTVQGLETVIRGGRYTGYGDNKKLQYPVEGDLENIVGGVLFGRSGLDETEDYYASEESALSVKQTKMYQSLVEKGADGKAIFEAIQKWRAVNKNEDMTSYTRAAQQRDMIRELDMADDMKLEMYREMTGAESRADKFAELLGCGLNWDQVMDIYEEYCFQDSQENLTATQKATKFKYWIDSRRFTEAQVEKITDTFKFYNIIPAEAGKYEKLVESGLEPDEAMDLISGLNKLEPIDGADQVADVQKWRTCVDAFGVPMYQLAALASYMTDAQFKKAKTADAFGVDLSNFVKLYEIRAEYDENGNKSYSNAEYKKAIDSLGLSTQDSAVLWQLLTGAKSAKNNPYSSTIGQKVIDAMAE